jgi:plastocyanin
MLEMKPRLLPPSQIVELCFLGLALSVVSPIWSQTGELPSGASSVSEVKFCGQWSMTEAFFDAHPHLREQAEQASEKLEKETTEFSDANRDELIIIPVVFHVIHYNGPENISDDQVLSAVSVMNRDFRKLNEDVSDVIDPFIELANDVEIEFRLAQRDPNGDCHIGINRILSQLTYDGGGEVKDLIQWPRNSYLNIWVVENAAGAAGYSLYPSSVNGNQGAGNDGIVVAHDYTGNIGTSNNYRSRTLTHEAGHWMNLRHTWGNSNNPGEADNCDNDDNVDDTPLTSGWTSCNVNGETCGSLDNVQNYMEYSYCGRMFSTGQGNRMRTAMYSNVAQRNQLWTSQNLEETGVLEGPILCEARFSASRQTICAGDSVQFFDNSYHGVTAWNWTFGDCQAGVGENPWNQFLEPGLYDVTLTVSNESGEESLTQVAFIQVLPAGALALPFSDDFEADNLSSDWFTVDVGLDGEGWELTSAASVSGSQSIKIQNWSNLIEFNSDQLVSSSMDMSAAEEIHISYKWAYCYKGTNEDDDETDDRLKVYASPDCGETWSLRRMHRGYTDLPSAPPHPFSFTPNGPDEWNSYTLVLPYEQFFTGNFRMMFEFESLLGNNIFLDDVNIEVFTASDLLERERLQGIPLEVFPNPASGSAWLEFQTGMPHKQVQIDLLDMTGRLVESVFSGFMAPGMQRLPVGISNPRSGAYIVSVKLDGIPSTERIIFE